MQASAWSASMLSKLERVSSPPTVLSTDGVSSTAVAMQLSRSICHGAK